jgi:peptide methionine sulfoxide reductase msrA/msrB
MRNISFSAFFLALLTLLLSQAHAQADSAKASAILAGGCFWCVESDFEKLDGVYEVVSGYTGGHLENPTYKEVGSGKSGHIEAAVVSYDPAKLSYRDILDYFMRHIDPTDNRGQFCDRGPQYRPAIFFHNEEEKTTAETLLAELETSKPFSAPINVELIAASTFYPAEDYHQDYYKKNPYRYKFYRFSCGRDARVNEIWGKAD